MKVRSGCRARRRSGASGFTLVELMIVVAIVVILASVGVPMFQTALQNARIAKCIANLKSLATDIETFRMMNGRFPTSLVEVGWGHRLDPWGNPYEYLVIEAQLASGMESLSANGTVTGGNDTKVVSTLTNVLNQQVAANPGAAIAAISKALSKQGGASGVEDSRYIRKSLDLFPLNTGYDLYSMGSDEQSAARIDQAVSLDDVIRANDGRYYGLAKDY